MNDNIRAIWNQAASSHQQAETSWETKENFLNRFAELIVRDWSSYRDDISYSTQDLRHEPGLELIMTHSKAQLLENHLRELNHLQTERYMNQIEISRELDLRLRVPAVAAAWDHYRLMLKLAQ